MRKKIILILISLFIILLFILINKSSHFNINGRVAKIEIFDGNTGQKTIIEDKKVIRKLVENLNGITLKKDSLSLFRMGYKYRLTLYSEKGMMGGYWGTFIINGTDKIRRDPFFYKTVDGQVDIDLIENLFE